jgi:hypothetical protein
MARECGFKLGALDREGKREAGQSRCKVPPFFRFECTGHVSGMKRSVWLECTERADRKY